MMCRLTRIIRQPGGHALLLVGFDAEGQKIAKLAAFAAGMELYELSVSRNYKLENWKDTLRKGILSELFVNSRVVMFKAGLLGVSTVFLCSDAEMGLSFWNIPFFEDLNNLIQNGTVPDLFNGDDRKIITQSIDSVSIKDGAKVYGTGYVDYL